MSFYQPAHAPSLTKHNNQVYEFDSPNTIAKQQQHGGLQPFVQAGGAPSTSFSAPSPPPLPQLGFSQTRPLRLKTRDWNSQPWKGASDAYSPPASLLWNSNSSSRIPIYMNSPSKTWGNRSISSTSASPRTRRSASLLGVYDPSLLAGQTTHLQKKSNPSSPSNYSVAHIHHPSNLPPFASNEHTSNLPPPFTRNELPAATELSPSQSHHSGLPTTHYQPLSTIPISHNHHLPSSSLAHSTLPSDIVSDDASSSSSYENDASSWNGPSSSSSSSFSNIPAAPRLPSFFGYQRKWRSGPYKQRPLRTRSWGVRDENGWANLNRGIYTHESALPFMANKPSLRDLWNSEKETSSRQLPAAAPISTSSSIPQQSFAPIQKQQQSFAPIQQQSFAPILQQSFAPIRQQSFPAPIAAVPLAAAAPLPAPLTGRKGRRAARKASKQAAIQHKLTTELNPPIGDPAVNQYRRGAKATVPLAPAVAPSGSLGTRRTGRKNNFSRRGRLAAPAPLPIPAVQPILAQQPTIIPLSANSAVFTPLSSSYVSRAPSFVQTVPIQQQSFLMEKQYVEPAPVLRPTGSATF